MVSWSHLRGAFMRVMAFVSLLLILTGCIDVDDLGDTWSKAKPDKSLVGKWHSVPFEDPEKHTQKTFIEFKDLGDHLEAMLTEEGDVEQKDAPIATKTLIYGGKTFLLMRSDKPESKSGTLILYERKDDSLVFSVLQKPELNPFIKTQKQKFLIYGDYNIYKIAFLSDAAISELADIANTPGAFTEYSRYKRDAH